METKEHKIFIKEQKTDATILFAVITILLPNSKTGKFTPLTEIMERPFFAMNKISKRRIILVITKKTCAELFDIDNRNRRLGLKNPENGEKNELEVRINPNHFFSIEERGENGFNCIEELSKNQKV